MQLFPNGFIFRYFSMPPSDIRILEMPPSGIRMSNLPPSGLEILKMQPNGKLLRIRENLPTRPTNSPTGWSFETDKTGADGNTYISLCFYKTLLSNTICDFHSLELRKWETFAQKKQEVHTHRSPTIPINVYKGLSSIRDKFK